MFESWFKKILKLGLHITLKIAMRINLENQNIFLGRFLTVQKKKKVEIERSINSAAKIERKKKRKSKSKKPANARAHADAKCVSENADRSRG